MPDEQFYSGLPVCYIHADDNGLLVLAHVSDGNKQRQDKLNPADITEITLSPGEDGTLRVRITLRAIPEPHIYWRVLSQGDMARLIRDWNELRLAHSRTRT